MRFLRTSNLERHEDDEVSEEPVQSPHVELLLEDNGFAVGDEKVAQVVEDPENEGRYL